MSAPEVGDRARVIAGQWTGWEGVVKFAGSCWFDVRIDTHPEGHPSSATWVRVFGPHEVERVPTTPTDGHRGDETGADVVADPDAGSGAQGGGKR